MKGIALVTGTSTGIGLSTAVYLAVNLAYLAAMPIGAPGWPEFAFCTPSIAAGRASHNVVIYWNETPKR